MFMSDCGITFEINVYNKECNLRYEIYIQRSQRRGVYLGFGQNEVTIAGVSIKGAMFTVRVNC